MGRESQEGVLLVVLNVTAASYGEKVSWLKDFLALRAQLTPEGGVWFSPHPWQAGRMSGIFLQEILSYISLE